MREVSSPFDLLFRELPQAYAPAARVLRDNGQHFVPESHKEVTWNHPFWTGNRAVLSLQYFENHLSRGVLRGAELTRRYPRLEGTDRSMRYVKVRTGDTARSCAITEIIRAAARPDRRYP